MRSALVLGAALALAACGSDTSQTAPPPAPNAGPTTPPAADPAAEPGVSLLALLDESADAAALQARLADPLRVESEAVQNRHDPEVTDTVRTYVYDSVRLRFYDRSNGGPLLERVTVTGGAYETAEGVGPGSTRAKVEAAYGEPADTFEGDPIYEIPSTPDDPAPLRMQVRYAGDVAERLTWYFYVD